MRRVATRRIRLGLSILLLAALPRRGLAQPSARDGSTPDARHADEGDRRSGGPPDAEPSTARATRFFERLDANHDGIVTEGEALDLARQRFRDAVAAGDQDGDSQMTLLEFQRATLVYDQKHGPPPPPADGRPPPAAVLFRMFDRNGDGKLYLAEVPDAHRAHIEGMFLKAGRDPRESLTSAEFERLSPREDEDHGRDDAHRADDPESQPGAGSDRGPPRPESVFQLFDRNRDGKLLAKEMPEPHRAHLLQMLEHLGRSPDDYVSVDEFKSVVSQGRPERPEPVAPPNPGPLAGSSLAAAASNGAGSSVVGAPPTPAEPPSAEAAFVAIDRNRDGFVDRAEANVAPRTMRGWIGSVFERSGKDLLTLTDVTTTGLKHPSDDEDTPRATGR